METIDISKSQIVKVERAFGRGSRTIITTETGKYDILKEGEIFTTFDGEKYMFYEILPNGLVEQLNKAFKVK